MPKLQVFDPPMCCPGGVCGPSVDPALPRFAAELDWLQDDLQRAGLTPFAWIINQASLRPVVGTLFSRNALLLKAGLSTKCNKGWRSELLSFHGNPRSEWARHGWLKRWK